MRNNLTMNHTIINCYVYLIIYYNFTEYYFSFDLSNIIIFVTTNIHSFSNVYAGQKHAHTSRHTARNILSNTQAAQNTHTHHATQHILFLYLIFMYILIIMQRTPIMAHIFFKSLHIARSTTRSTQHTTLHTQ